MDTQYILNNPHKYIKDNIFTITINVNTLNNKIVNELYEIYINHICTQYKIPMTLIDIHDKTILVVYPQKKVVYCNILNLSYIHDIVKNNNDINCVYFMKLDDDDIKKINTCDIDALIHAISHPNIKKIFINQRNISNVFFKINWKKTFIRSFDFYNLNASFDMIGWLQENKQVYTIDVSRAVSHAINENNSSSLLYCHTNSHGNSQLLLKRKKVKQEILTLFLISKSKHKYFKYAPKTIILLILNHMYDINYLAIHDYLQNIFCKYISQFMII